MPANPETTCANKKAFIKAYPEYGSIGEALKAVGVKSRKTFYNWMSSDPAFKATYETQLLPNRRDQVQSVVYRMATAHQSVALCPVCKGTGKYSDKNCHGCRGKGWVEVHADGAQLTAAFGMLKASDRAADEHDKLTFVDKNQLEVTGKDGTPLPTPTFIFNMPDGKQFTAKELASGNGNKT